MTESVDLTRYPTDKASTRNATIVHNPSMAHCQMLQDTSIRRVLFTFMQLPGKAKPLIALKGSKEYAEIPIGLDGQMNRSQVVGWSSGRRGKCIWL